MDKERPKEPRTEPEGSAAKAQQTDTADRPAEKTETSLVRYTDWASI